MTPRGRLAPRDIRKVRRSVVRGVQRSWPCNEHVTVPTNHSDAQTDPRQWPAIRFKRFYSIWKSRAHISRTNIRCFGQFVVADSEPPGSNSCNYCHTVTMGLSCIVWPHCLLPDRPTDGQCCNNTGLILLVKKSISNQLQRRLMNDCRTTAR